MIGELWAVAMVRSHAAVFYIIISTYGIKACALRTALGNVKVIEFLVPENDS